jgi:hypothetical protein
MSDFLSVRFEGTGSKEVLKAAKKEVKAKVKAASLSAAEDTVLPRARELAPSIVSSAITIKGAVKGPKLTTTGPRRYDRIAGLLNYGGTVKTVIQPKDHEGHQALAVGGNVVRARVTKPRTYRGKHFIEHAVEETFGEFQQKVLPLVMDVFNGLDHTP